MTGFRERVATNSTFAIGHGDGIRARIFAERAEKARMLVEGEDSSAGIHSRMTCCSWIVFDILAWSSIYHPSSYCCANCSDEPQRMPSRRAFFSRRLHVSWLMRYHRPLSVRDTAARLDGNTV
jgi:hypothetical protein